MDVKFLDIFNGKVSIASCETAIFTTISLHMTNLSNYASSMLLTPVQQLLTLCPEDVCDSYPVSL